MADRINESKAEAENLQKLKEIQRVVDGLHEVGSVKNGTTSTKWKIFSVSPKSS